MAIKLITGYTGTEHITAADDAGFNKSVYGSDDYVFTDVSYTIDSNNQITVNAFEGMIQGRRFRIAENDSEPVTIDNGSQGQKRIDIIAVQYSKLSIEKVELKVVKGASTTGTPTAPTLTTADIDNGGTLHQMALIQVPINGITIDTANVKVLAQSKTKSADYIVKQDTEIIDSQVSFDYVKYNSGKLKGTIVWTIPSLTFSAMGSVYGSNLDRNFNGSTVLKTIKHARIYYQSPFYLWGNSVTITALKLSSRVYSPASGSSANVVVKFDIVGTWK